MCPSRLYSGREDAELGSYTQKTSTYQMRDQTQLWGIIILNPQDVGRSITYD
jgi:hypothetical protein